MLWCDASSTYYVLCILLILFIIYTIYASHYLHFPIVFYFSYVFIITIICKYNVHYSVIALTGTINIDEKVVKIKKFMKALF